MKKNLLLAASALVCSLMLINCGGGSGKSSLSKNNLIGDLPAIVTNSNLASDELKKETEEEAKSVDKNDIGKAIEILEKYKKGETEIKEKFKADYAAEVAKITGTAIPFTYSEELKNSPELFYDIKEVKTDSKDNDLFLTFKIAAKADFTIKKYDGISYGILFRFKNADGQTLRKCALLPFTSNATELVFKASELIDDKSTYPISLNSHNSALYENFDGIEFITEQQHTDMKVDNTVKEENQ